MRPCFDFLFKDNLLQAALAQERLRWQKEIQSERSKAAEAAVAIAEVKWLEEEERKICEAVEQALQAARDGWKEEKQRQIGKWAKEIKINVVLGTDHYFFEGRMEKFSRQTIFSLLSTQTIFFPVSSSC